MSKFKVGDRVRVARLNYGPSGLVGKTGTVTGSAWRTNEVYVELGNKDNGLWFAEEELEAAE